VIVRILPSSRTGRLALTLTAAFALLFVGHILLFRQGGINPAWRPILRPAYSIILLSCGTAAGIFGARAIGRDRDRAVLVWLTLLAPILVAAFLLRIIRPPTNTAAPAGTVTTML
jgi:hypothetical protein